MRKADGALGVLLINKSSRAYDVGVNLPAIPQSVTARRIGPAEYAAASGPATVATTKSSRRVTVPVPATSIVGLEIR